MRLLEGFNYTLSFPHQPFTSASTHPPSAALASVPDEIMAKSADASQKVVSRAPGHPWRSPTPSFLGLPPSLLAILPGSTVSPFHELSSYLLNVPKLSLHGTTLPLLALAVLTSQQPLSLLQSFPQCFIAAFLTSERKIFQWLKSPYLPPSPTHPAKLSPSTRPQVRFYFYSVSVMFPVPLHPESPEIKRPVRLEHCEKGQWSEMMSEGLPGARPRKARSHVHFSKRLHQWHGCAGHKARRQLWWNAGHRVARQCWQKTEQCYLQSIPSSCLPCHHPKSQPPWLPSWTTAVCLVFLLPFLSACSPLST